MSERRDYKPQLSREEIEEWRKSMLEVYVSVEERKYEREVNALCDMALAALPSAVAGSDEVQHVAIEIEKKLCGLLGRPWTAAGISIETLVNELCAQSHARSIEPIVGQSGGNWAVWLVPGGPYLWSFDGPRAKDAAESLAEALKRQLAGARSSRGATERHPTDAQSLKSATGVPAGWCAVPIEPSQAMLDAGNAADYAATTHRPAGRVWEAMLRACARQNEP